MNINFNLLLEPQKYLKMSKVNFVPLFTNGSAYISHWQHLESPGLLQHAEVQCQSTFVI